MQTGFRLLVIALIVVGSGCGESPDDAATTITAAAEGGSEPADSQGSSVTEAGAYAIDIDGEVFAIDTVSGASASIAELLHPGQFWAVGTDLWINGQDGFIHLDAAGNELGIVELHGPFAFAAGDDVAWVLSIGETIDDPPCLLSRVDVTTHEVTAAIDIAACDYSEDVVFGDGLVWFSHLAEGDDSAAKISRVDPDSLTSLGSTATDIVPEALAWGEGSLWAAGGVEGENENVVHVLRISPEGTLEATIEATGFMGWIDLAAGHGSVWLADTTGSELVRIDPATDAEVARIPVGEPAAADSALTVIGVGSEYVLVANPADELIYQVDPGADAVVGSFTYPGRLVAFP